MPEKYFIVSPTIESIGKEAIQRIATEKIENSDKAWLERENKIEKAMHEDCKLKHVKGRVIIRVNAESKNYDGIFRRERRFNNFNFREVNPSNAFIISAENMPIGCEVLVDYTSIHDSNKIFDYDSSSNDVVYYSIKEEDCFAWRMGTDDWQPAPDYEFGLRCYEKYQGVLVGIQPKFIKNVLYITTGDLKGLISHTVVGADYQIVFTDTNGKEGNIIRINRKKEEIVCVSLALTERLHNGEILVGLSPHDAKAIKNE